jgi:hypothetical protein
MNRRAVGLTYAGVTSALLVVTWVSWTGVRDAETMAIWVGCCAALGLSQIAFLVIAARMKYNVVLVLAGALLLAIAGFNFVLFNMPS